MTQDLDFDRERTTRAWRAAPGRVAPTGRIWVATGTVLALLGVGVLIAAFLMGRLGAEAEDLTRRQVEYTTALTGAALNAKGIANDERGYLLSGDDEFLVEIDIRTAQAREYFEEAAIAAGEAHIGRIRQAHQVFERWLVALEEEIATFRSGDREAARAASLGPTRDLRKEYEALLATAALAESGVPTASASVSRSASRSVIILLAYLLAAIIIGYTVNAWAVRGLRRTDS